MCVCVMVMTCCGILTHALLLGLMFGCLMSLTTPVSSQLSVGDLCSLRDGSRGVCRFLANCPSAVAVLRLHKPVLCSFQGRATVICCGDDGYNRLPFTSLNSRPIRYEDDDSEDIDEVEDEDDRIILPSVPYNRMPGRGRPFLSGDRIPPGKSPPYTSKTRKQLVHTTPADMFQFDVGPNPYFTNGAPRPPIVGIPSSDGKSHTQTVSRAEQDTGAGRKSHLKCKEYSQSVMHRVEALPLLPDPDPVIVDVPFCDITKLPLIVGGEKTHAGEFPHMAALGYRDGQSVAWNCGGSLISDLFVLTAAHCIISSKGPPVVVRLGELNLKRDDDGARPRDYGISSIIRHPDYRPPSKYNDIALLRLSETLQFSKFIRPACLFTEEVFPVNKTVATGWGQIDYAEQPSEHLLKVALDIIGNEQCNYLYRSSSGTQTLPQGITQTMLCAGELKGGKDTCHGDSGGPIQITNRQNKCIYYVIGVTSFGKFCAAENAPGVYTRVSRYVPWIESIVWP